MRDIAGNLISRHGNHCGVTNCTLCKYRNIRGASANIDHCHTQIFFILRQNGVSRRQRLQNQIADFQTASPYALDNVLCGRHCTRDNMHFDLKANTTHTQRFPHVFLAIHQILLRQDMQNLLIGWDIHGAGGFQHPINIHLRDFLVTYRCHAV